MPKRNNNSVSLAGEFAVLSQLALQNYDANMTLGHTKSVDILVSDPLTSAMYRLEVKTRYQARKKDKTSSKVFGNFLDSWMMNKKHEKVNDASLFYCFVIILKRKEVHGFRFFIVPSNVVARYVKDQHQHWLTEKRKEGSKVKDNDMRLFRIGLEGEKYSVVTPLAKSYEDNWKFQRP
jgi:hypothetical protein